MRELLIVRGLPGTGKSTLARKIAYDTGARHVESDMFWGSTYKFDPTMIRQSREWCLLEATRYLHAGYKVVASCTFTTMNEIRPYIYMARNMGVKVSFMTCTIEYGSIHNVPKHIIEDMKRRWEPLNTEVWEDVILKSEY